MWRLGAQEGRQTLTVRNNVCLLTALHNFRGTVYNSAIHNHAIIQYKFHPLELCNMVDQSLMGASNLWIRKGLSRRTFKLRPEI